MNEKVLRVLDYNKIVDFLVEKSVSAMGKEISSCIKASNKIDDVKKLQSETSDAVSLILRKNSLPLGCIKDIRNILNRVKIHGILSCKELMCVADFLYVSEKIKLYSKGYDGILVGLFSKINLANELKSEIEKKIDGNEICDDASTSLFSLRKNIRVANLKIKEVLNNFIRNSSGMLQDNIISIKNNRYCLPVRREFKNSFNGIVHDQSVTGSTVFVEPAFVVQLNNKIKELTMQENAQVQKILKEISEKTAENFMLLSQNIYAIANLDFIFARAQLSISMKASEPILNSNGYIDLKRARHPLINSEKVVPLDISLGRKFSTLLITGPNTGGKTVSLKTVGLFVLMAQSGLHIPADENSQIAVFENIFADMGDEQSIQQNLSTFSAHMKNINEIVNHANANSLILLDELGAGTDPVEGAALAIAILEYFFSLKAKVVVTSHYSELKLYAMTTDGVENASCEFDITTLSPTYRLLIGTPGKSNAFEISKRIGLSEKIIESARKNLERKDIQFEDIIKNLDDKQLEIKIKSEQAEKLFSEADAIKKKLEDEQEKFMRQKESQFIKAKAKALNIINAAREKSDLLLKSYRENNFKMAEKIKSEIKNEQEKLISVNKNSADKKNMISIEKLKVGDRVFCFALSQSGILKTLPDADKNVMISIGSFNTKVAVSDLKICDVHDSGVKENKIRTGNFSMKKSFDISSKIDVRGCSSDEALVLVDKYIDDAIIARLNEITIIHGKGNGVLRKVIGDYMKKNVAVKSFRLGNFGEGELGVTIAQLG